MVVKIQVDQMSNHLVSRYRFYTFYNKLGGKKMNWSSIWSSSSVRERNRKNRLWIRARNPVKYPAHQWLSSQIVSSRFEKMSIWELSLFTSSLQHVLQKYPNGLWIQKISLAYGRGKRIRDIVFNKMLLGLLYHRDAEDGLQKPLWKMRHS